MNQNNTDLVGKQVTLFGVEKTKTKKISAKKKQMLEKYPERGKLEWHTIKRLREEEFLIV